MERVFPREDLDNIVSSTDFQSIKNENIFLTGGTGFIGRWFIESFHHANKMQRLNSHLTILSRSPESFLQGYPKYQTFENIKFIKGDVTNVQNISDNYTFVIHAATDSDSRLNKGNALHESDVIVRGTRNILDLAVNANAKRFLYLSSGAVYGKLTESHVTENDPNAPLIDDKNTYGESKRYSELLCKIYSKKFGLHVSIARCFAFVGPGLPLDSAYAAGNFIKNLLDKEPIQIKGDGSPRRSFMYPSDLMIWLWTILFRANSGETFNVGSDLEISILELAQKISSFDENMGNVFLTNTLAAGAPIHYYVPSTEKAKKDLALQLKVKLDEAILKTIQFHRGSE
jgi:nucleoside-diphosphate-sugar epimerase